MKKYKDSLKKIELGRRYLVILTLVAVLTLAFAVLAAGDKSQSSSDSSKALKANLKGFNEVPAISTTGSGEFRGKISQDETSIEYELSYSGLEGTATAAHIHLGQKDVNGGIIAFLCGGGGKPACPASGTVTGTIMAADIIGPAGQGISAGEFAEALKAIRSGVTYANVHSSMVPGGEIRGQIK